jgi:acetoin utilization deacetylase AcuC-like enzyme
MSVALQRVVDFNPVFLVVALGFDPAKGDPTGTWSLTPRDFEVNGRMLGELGFPMLVVQEGGSRTRTLGVNALRFFEGLAAGHGVYRPDDLKKKQSAGLVKTGSAASEPPEG